MAHKPVAFSVLRYTSSASLTATRRHYYLFPFHHNNSFFFVQWNIGLFYACCYRKPWAHSPIPVWTKQKQSLKLHIWISVFIQLTYIKYICRRQAVLPVISHHPLHSLLSGAATWQVASDVWSPWQPAKTEHIDGVKVACVWAFHCQHQEHCGARPENDWHETRRGK